TARCGSTHPTRCRPGAARRSGAAGRWTRPAPRATARSEPALRPAGTPSIPSPSARVGRAAPTSRTGSPHPAGARSPPPADPWPGGTVRTPDAAPGPELPGERGIGAVVAQLEQLVEQRGRPQVRVLAQPFPAVADERLERIRLGPPALAGDPAPLQVGADGLAVMSQVSGDRRDRPAPAMQRVRVHIVLPCDHERWRSLHGLRVVRDQQLRRDLRRLDGATRVGKFSKQVWGDSPERHHLAVSSARTGRHTQPSAPSSNTSISSASRPWTT